MTFEEFINYLKDEADVGINIPATDVQIAMANVKLKQAKIPALPNDFTQLLKNFNGISNEGAIMLGANTNSTLFPDIVNYNISILSNSETNSVILGYNEWFYLIYDYTQELYRIVDKDDFNDEGTFGSLPKALAYILRV